MSDPMDTETRVIHNLSKLIASALSAQAGESQRPRRDADASDYYIGEAGKRAQVLRRLRQEFEDEMARDLTLDPR